MRRPIRSSKIIASAARYHPSWDKVYGNPAEPATSIVFGEKGSGKTALRLQIVRHLADYNGKHPNGAVVRHRVRRFQSVSRSLRRERLAGHAAAISCCRSGNCGITWMRSCRWA